MRRIMLLISIALTTGVWGRTIRYVDDNTTNFPNPERGFHTGYQLDVTKETTQSDMQDSWFDRSQGRSLLMRIYMLTGYREDSLSQEVLDLINSDFAMFRKNGSKCLLRFSYTDFWQKVEGKFQDASPEIWHKHLQQLKPVLHANADVIALVQAGFLGVWGEWHSSSTDTGQGIPQQVKNDLLDWLLDAVPVDRTVQLRTPGYKHAYIGDTMALSSEEAFTGTARARIGHHNDAFLYQSSNMGTYTNRAVDMDFLARECLYVPNGGESCVEKKSVYDKWANGTVAQQEMAQLHYSYLAGDFHSYIMSGWQREGVYETIGMKMGYRFMLKQTTLPATAVRGETLPIHITIENVGYATPYNERQAYLVLRGADTTYTMLLRTDPRRWLPNGARTELRDTMLLPEDMQTGTYEVCLWLPDPYESIRYDARFAIRMANDEVWEATTGYNNLLTTVEVDTILQPEPFEPEPEVRAEVEGVKQLIGLAGGSSARLSWKNPSFGEIIHTRQVPLTTGESTAFLPEQQQSSAVVSNSDSLTKVQYMTTTEWLWAGVQYPVKQMDESWKVEFEYQGDGQEVSLIPYVRDTRNRWVGSPVQVSLSSTEWCMASIHPSRVLWSADSTYNYGKLPITHVGFMANPSRAIMGEFSIRNVRLKQVTDSVYPFAGVQVVRKHGSMPQSPNDGEVVYYGRDSVCIDTALVYGETYYYAVYAFDRQQRWSYPATCAVTIDGSALRPTEVAEEPARKILKDGRILILRGGRRYDILGGSR